MAEDPTGHDTQTCPGLPACPQCVSEAMLTGYHGIAGEHGPELFVPSQNGVIVRPVTCPACGHLFAPVGPVRVTEAAPVVVQVEYADPGKRWPLDTEARARAAWSAVAEAGPAVRGRVRAALRRFGVAVPEATEAMIDGKRSYNDTADLVRDALRARARAASGTYVYVWVADLTDTDVVYADDLDCDDLWQCSYAVDVPGNVTLGEPSRVVRTYAPAPAGMPPDDDAPGMPGSMDDDMAYEAVQVTLSGRVIEAKGKATDGGRIFRSRIIAYGDSANARRYPEAVMRAAAPLYEGTRAFDGHRSKDALASSSVETLVGYWRNVEATADGLEADLYLLPSAGRVAEALDASLALAGEGLAPLIGVSHDVMATFKPVVEAGRRLQEATAIVQVLSADVVADPAAGGKPVRMVAGGLNPDDGTCDETRDDPAQGETTGESDMTVTADDVLGALKTATPEQLAAYGLQHAATESTPPPTPDPEPVTEAAGELKTSYLGRLMIRSKIEDAGLPAATVESLAATLPDRITEATLDAQIATLKAALGIAERSGLVPTTQTAQVAAESIEKKIKALDATFAGDFGSGYTSFRSAYLDITGYRPKSLGEDLNRRMMRESIGGRGGDMYDSADRSTESLTAASWDVILGDSITRRMVADYGRPSLQTWRQIVSSTVPINDFRTQRLDRLGGYGTLPTVNQGAPYQPLTSPTDEEATYSITKKGGTEDLTLEMIADDDLRAIANIPKKLGLAAAQTLYRFVWDMLAGNTTCTFDSVALFHASHSNTTAAALSQTNLSALRASMRGQSAYGDSKDILSLIPQYLVVPSALEELAWQLCTSMVAIPATPAGAANTPNIHHGMTPLVIDYFTDTNDWFVVADPSMCPTIEIGFYQGRQEPELFTQADPTVGSMFNADTLTYKIRHIYSGTPIDFRGFQRGTQ
jgi:hypothetical protein